MAALRCADGFDTSLSLVALNDNRVVGHILFSSIHVETDRGNLPAVALAPMAVLPAYQRKGIGSALVREGLGACRRAGHNLVVVLGHPEYYPRFGFLPASRYGLRPPFPAPDEAFMAIALVPDGLKGVAGVVRYPTAFGDAQRR